MSNIAFDNAIKDFLDTIGQEKLYNESATLERFYKTQPAMSYNVPSKKVAKVVLPKEFDRGVIVPLYDVHLGSKNCFKELFLKTVNFIHSTPNCYTLLGGDLMESATRQSIGLGMIDEEFHLTDQLRMLTEILKPLADEGRIIGAITGNHEMRPAYLNGWNPIAELANNLGIPYFGYQGYISFYVGEQNYKIFIHHGVGSGRTKGGKVNAMMRPNTVAIADLYITGHIHDKFGIPDSIFDIENDEIVQRTRYYVTSGSFLQYFGGYPEMQLLAPSCPGALMIELLGEEKSIRIHN